MIDAEIRTVPAQTVAYLPMRGPYAQVPEGYQRLYGWIGQEGLQPVGMPSAVYYTAPDTTPEAEAEWELRAPVAPGSAPADPGEAGVGVKEVAEALVAATVHVGPYDTLAATYGELARWLAEQGYAIAGPPSELYLNDPAECGPENTRTEIRFPVMQLS